MAADMSYMEALETLARAGNLIVDDYTGGLFTFESPVLNSLDAKCPTQDIPNIPQKLAEWHEALAQCGIRTPQELGIVLEALPMLLSDCGATTIAEAREFIARLNMQRFNLRHRGDSDDC